MTDYQMARASLGARLRELRVEARLSGRALAEALGWPPSKVSRLELGRQTASVEDLEAWSVACGVPGAAVELSAQRRALETHYTSWRRQLAAGTRARQAASKSLEDRTRRFRIFETSCVPGLLQTPDYARHVLRHVIDFHRSPDDLEAGVRVRMERRRIIDEPGRVFDILVWEPALRTALAPPAVMAEQMDHIADVIQRGVVGVSVLPIAARVSVVPAHGFWMFDEGRVLIETTGAELSLTDDDAIAPYRKAFAELSRSAVRGAAALRIVARARQGFISAREG
ncbi:Transcriptional regulator, contains XRE-family HTH domain [Marinactinospora thermotolerans DSM 45154]|uniref:Transcriptional regulator, contains XRE-family HTH domain n=1 Tax=Marinactinospora thermotolerans DSM 45154 TaxID=1122192 RepID=A0A1T4TE57_9ACTN|nr:helix-turn-helix transcriptional regulator [Marinactinospora thermotolerans]SKA38469.1 Transcriptional regulator, contains XRE-family HTH domain [Marinactinospora thermotolerans DSM 45154]